MPGAFLVGAGSKTAGTGDLEQTAQEGHRALHLPRRRAPGHSALARRSAMDLGGANTNRLCWTIFLDEKKMDDENHAFNTCIEVMIVLMSLDD